MHFDLTVQGDDGQTYEGHTHQTMHDVTLNGITQSGQVIVQVDPDDPQSLLVWGPA